jgi:hypothetical protein
MYPRVGDAKSVESGARGPKSARAGGDGDSNLAGGCGSGDNPDAVSRASLL